MGVSERACWRDFKISILVILHGSDRFDLAAARHSVCMRVFERERDGAERDSLKRANLSCD